jgi:dipeptidyl aminopeptidase/acylaminoacyl peptidase
MSDETTVISQPRHRRGSAGRVWALAAGLSVLLGVPGELLSQTGSRGLDLEDYVRHRTVSDPQVSPDGRWVVFSVSEMVPGEDRRQSALWIAPIDGSEVRRRLTEPGAGARSHRWSPDGRYLAFLSSRDGSGTQIWALPLAGGEPFPVTALEPGVASFEWAPGGDRFVVTRVDPVEPRPSLLDASAGLKEDGRSPFVILRLQFLRDGAGYMGYIGERYRQLHVVEFRPSGAPVTEALQITHGPYDNTGPTWSPDGRWIVFTSNRSEWPDLNTSNDLWAVPADGGDLIRLTSDEGSESGAVWSPDARQIAFSFRPRHQYSTSRLRTLEIDWSEGRPSPGRITPVPEALDRAVRGSPQWSEDGAYLYFVIQDRGTEPLIRARVAGGDPEVLLGGAQTVRDFRLVPGREQVVAILSWDTQPADVFAAPLTPRNQDVPLSGADAHVGMAAMGNPAYTNLSRANSDWLDEVRLSRVRPIRFPSWDGTPIEGWYMTPDTGRAPHPLIVRIHGGPVAQYTWAYDFERQWFVAQGYAVLFINPRGSSGRGADFAYAIWKEWGEADFEDVMAGVDHLIEAGIADPERLGVGGWSYGGMLTNYIITKTDRFRAAVSGASDAAHGSLYGTDDLQRLWEFAGLPWEDPEFYERSSSINFVTNITTPTLFIVGAEDRRTPANQSEQMYIRLRRLEIPTGLIVYPGESHGIARPSYQIDRFRRNQEWYAKYVLGDPEADPYFGRLSW